MDECDHELHPVFGDEFAAELQVHDDVLEAEIPQSGDVQGCDLTNNWDTRENDMLRRARRTDGASRMALGAARELNCEVCEANLPSKSHLPAELRLQSRSTNS